MSDLGRQSRLNRCVLIKPGTCQLTSSEASQYPNQSSTCLVLFKLTCTNKLIQIQTIKLNISKFYSPLNKKESLSLLNKLLHENFWSNDTTYVSYLRYIEINIQEKESESPSSKREYKFDKRNRELDLCYHLSRLNRCAAIQKFGPHTLSKCNNSILLRRDKFGHHGRCSGHLIRHLRLSNRRERCTWSLRGEIIK